MTQMENEKDLSYYNKTDDIATNKIRKICVNFVAKIKKSL